jgi:hypothetical protein
VPFPANLQPVSSRLGWRDTLAALGALAVIGLVPLGWRLAAGAWGPDPGLARPSYLPSLEAERVRGPFQDTPVGELRDMQPGLVIVGDSMAGRLDEGRLSEISGLSVAPILQNATGSAYWYLVLQNYVVASGIRPTWVLIFFRDTNLTDVMFRLDGPYRSALDAVAREREPALDAVVARRMRGPWANLYGMVEAAYHARSTRDWIEPAITAWPARLVAAPGRESTLLERVNNTFTLDRLRPFAQADLAAADDQQADFARFVDVSVLPLMLDAARTSGFRLCFVRVMRRPTDGQPPAVSPALARYMGDLRQYIEARGAAFIDDHDDVALAQMPYGDGDHISRDARVPYTDRFWPKLRALTR